MQILRAIPVALLWLQAASAAPAAVERRQADVLTGALNKVVGALKTLDTAIMGLSADPNSVTPLLNEVQGAQKTLAEASTEIKGAKPVALLEAVPLLGPAQELGTTLQKTLGDLTAKKPVFDQLGVSSVVADALKQQKVAANDLTDTMFSKLPAIAKTLAGGTVDQLNKSLDDTIKAFETPGPAPGAPATPAPAPAAPKPAPAPAPAPKPPALTPAVPSPLPLAPQPVAA